MLMDKLKAVIEEIDAALSEQDESVTLTKAEMRQLRRAIGTLEQIRGEQEERMQEG